MTQASRPYGIVRIASSAACAPEGATMATQPVESVIIEKKRIHAGVTHAINRP